MFPLSLIVPVYNVEKYLRKCLESFLNEKVDLALFEVIIVNDGSQDSSKKIIDEFVLKYKNVSVVDQPNQGLAVARNVGAMRARGNYIWFVDSDDWLITNSITKIIACSEFYKPDIISINYEFSNGKIDKVRNYSLESKLYTGLDYLDLQIVENPVQYYVFNTKFYRVNDLKFENGIYHEDSLFTPIALFYAKSVVRMHEVCYIYNIRDGSIMTSKLKLFKHAADMVTVCLKLQQFLQSMASTKRQQKIMSKYLGIGVGGLYYYWKQLNSIEKRMVSNSFESKNIWISLALNCQWKYILALLRIKNKC